MDVTKKMKYQKLSPIEIQNKLEVFNGDMYALINANTPKPDEIEHQFISMVDKYCMSHHDTMLSAMIFIGLKYDDKYIIPEYQRDLVWTLKQKQDFIISALIDNPIGDFIFKEATHNNGATFHYSVIDGQQRIHALREFVMNQFPLEDGRYFSELLYWDQRRLFERRIVYYTVSNITLKDEIDIYLGRNKGGTAHTKEELEKAKKISEQAKIHKITKEKKKEFLNV